MSLTDEQTAIVKSTAPILKQVGHEITALFYKDLFEAHPEFLNFFNQSNQVTGVQSLTLANVIYFVAEHIDQSEALVPEMNIIAHKHRALTVKPEHYPTVGKYLLQAIAKSLGRKATPEILDAWSAAYKVIANMLIEVEQRLYDEVGSDEKDKDFVLFTIIKKEKIADGPIYSFELERRDGGKMYDYHSGQYITVRIKKNGMYHNRHYGLVRPFNGRTYRIGVRLLNDCEPKGIVSTELIENYNEGDTILVSLPAGSFSIVEDAEHHLFIAGGVGITVLSTMIEDLYKQGKSHKVTLIHCVQGQSYAAYRSRMRTYVPEKQFHLLHHDTDALNKIIEQMIDPGTHVYLCGSVSFMNMVEDKLDACNFSLSNVHTNAFQPLFNLARN